MNYCRPKICSKATLKSWIRKTGHRTTDTGHRKFQIRDFLHKPGLIYTGFTYSNACTGVLMSSSIQFSSVNRLYVNWWRFKPSSIYSNFVLPLSFQQSTITYTGGQPNKYNTLAYLFYINPASTIYPKPHNFNEHTTHEPAEPPISLSPLSLSHPHPHAHAHAPALSKARSPSPPPPPNNPPSSALDTSKLTHSQSHRSFAYGCVPSWTMCALGLGSLLGPGARTRRLEWVRAKRPAGQRRRRSPSLGNWW